MWDGLQIVKQVLEAGATIRVLDFPSLDLTTQRAVAFSRCFQRWPSESGYASYNAPQLGGAWNGVSASHQHSATNDTVSPMRNVSVEMMLQPLSKASRQASLLQ
jgi:hypothetical protein